MAKFESGDDLEYIEWMHCTAKIYCTKFFILVCNNCVAHKTFCQWKSKEESI